MVTVRTLDKQSESSEKRERLEKALDAVRDKYGSRSISPGAVMKNDLGIGDDYGRDEE